MRTEESKGLMAIIAVNVFFAISVVLIKMLKPFFNQFAMIFWRQLLVVLILLVIILVKKRGALKEFSKELCFYGFLMFFLQPLVFISALFFTSVANVMFLDALYIIFNIILADLLLGEKFSGREILFTLLGFIGAAIIFIPAIKMRITIIESIGLGLAILSAIFYALFITYSRGLRRKYSVEGLQFWGLLTSLVFILPFFLIFGEPLRIFSVGVKPVVLLAILGGVGLFAGFYAFIYGMKHLKVSTAGVILLLEAPLAAIIAFFILKEVPTIWTIVGGLIILIAGGLIVRNENTPA